METQQSSTVAKAERPAPTHYHSKRDLAARYNVTTRTIDRWAVDKLFPEPDLRLPSGACRWSDELVTAHERASVSKRG
jgi:hypothetical protein